MSGRLIDCEKLKKFLWEKSEDHRNTPEMSYGSSPCDLAMANAYQSVIDEIVSGRLDAQSPTPGQEGQWIPVSERLPDSIGFYLICYQDHLDAVKKIAMAFFNSANKWVDTDCFFSSVTHWMPLPPSPTSTGERE